MIWEKVELQELQIIIKEDKWAPMRQKSEIFTWWPHHRQRERRSVCVCLWAGRTAVFAPGSFLQVSFDDIIYQTGLLLAQSAGLRRTESCVWFVFHPLIGIGDRMSSLLVLSSKLPATDRRLLTHLCVCLCVCFSCLRVRTRVRVSVRVFWDSYLQFLVHLYTFHWCIFV